MSTPLRAAGYLTVLGGLQHIAPKAEMIGYDRLLPHRSTWAKDVTPAVVSFIKSKPKTPFFLDCGFFETHRRFDKADSYGYPDETPLDDPNYIIPPATLPDTPKTRKDMAGFHAFARILDNAVGEILSALEEAGLAENTLIISTTDHGIAFPQMKCCLKDRGWGVSLIMRGPGPFKAGTACDSLVSHLDIFPTICDYLQIEAPSWLEGKSILPVLRGEKQDVNDEVFAEVNWHTAYEPKRAVRTARWKFTKRFDGRTRDVLGNCDGGLSKNYWVKHGWKDAELEQEEALYDLVFDPAEHNNLANDQKHREDLADMRQRLRTWMVRTNDPVLKGPIPLPADARERSPDDPGRIVEPASI